MYWTFSKNYEHLDLLANDPEIKPYITNTDKLIESKKDLRDQDIFVIVYSFKRADSKSGIPVGFIVFEYIENDEPHPFRIFKGHLGFKKKFTKEAALITKHAMNCLFLENICDLIIAIIPDEKKHVKRFLDKIATYSKHENGKYYYYYRG